MRTAFYICSILVFAWSVVACGGESERGTEPAEVTAAAETETSGTGAEEEAEAEARQAPPPGADQPPPRPEEGPTEAPAVPGVALSVEMNEVRAQTSGADPEVRAQIEALDGGIVRVELWGFSSYCEPAPRLLAHLDGEVIRLFRAPTDVRSRCVQPYALTVHVGPIPAGEYQVRIGRPGQGEPAQVGRVEVAERGAWEEPERPSDVLAVSQSTDEGRGSGGSAIGGVTAIAPGATQIQLHAALPCTGGTPVLFGAYRDGDRLVLRPHQPDRLARCPSPVRAYTLVVETGDFEPASVALQTRQGEPVADADIAPSEE